MDTPEVDRLLAEPGCPYWVQDLVTVLRGLDPVDAAAGLAVLSRCWSADVDSMLGVAR